MAMCLSRSPAAQTITSHITPKTIAIPRSGWMKISAVGMPMWISDLSSVVQAIHFLVVGGEHSSRA